MFCRCVILAPSILNERRMVHIFSLIDINPNYKISKLQIAKESDWEECMIIKEASHINSLKEWCASVTCENIAAEAFFDMPEKNMCSRAVAAARPNAALTLKKNV